MDLFTIIQQNPVLYYFIIGFFALMVGSFLNVVIYRLPRMMENEWKMECKLLLGIDEAPQTSKRYNLILPGSSCPTCNSKISPFDNIPVISYLLLKGRCRNCDAPISIRYPLIELTSCILILAVAIKFGPTYQALFAFLFTWALITLSMIDYDHKLLPDNITLPFLWLGILCNMAGLYTDIESSLFGAIFGYLTLWSVYIIFKLITGKEGMGYGDFKLLAMIGAWTGWLYLPMVIIISSLMGSIIGIGLLITRKHKKSQPIPFGPFLAIAGWVAMMFGNSITGFYIDWAVN